MRFAVDRRVVVLLATFGMGAGCALEEDDDSAAGGSAGTTAGGRSGSAGIGGATAGSGVGGKAAGGAAASAGSPPGTGEGGDAGDASADAGLGGSEGGASGGGDSGGTSSGASGDGGSSAEAGGSAGSGAGTGSEGGAGSGGAPGSEGGAGGDEGTACAVEEAGQPASCAGLAATCGAGASADCCAAAALSGGEYLRGNDESYPATLCPFALDLYEVTVGRFRKFVDAYPGNTPSAGAGRNPNSEGDTGWLAEFDDELPVDQAALLTALKCHERYQTWTDDPGENETRPVTCVSWYEAAAFCSWDGGRLPTEAEWNFAAAGGTEQRYYPWSDPPGSTTITENHASYYVDDTQGCRGDGMDGCYMTDLVAVGTKQAGLGRYAHADLAGNAWEWVADYWGSFPSSCRNCINSVPGSLRMVRGGSMDTRADEVTTFYRGNGTRPEAHDAWTGFRCARPAAP
jgi:formylglycine-generating enzyme